MKKTLYRLIFWVVWSIGWVMMNIIMANAGLTTPKTIITLIGGAIASCIVTYLMAISDFFLITIIIGMIIYLILNFGLVGVSCFIYNLIWVIVTKKLTPKD